MSEARNSSPTIHQRRVRASEASLAREPEREIVAFGIGSHVCPPGQDTAIREEVKELTQPRTRAWCTPAAVLRTLRSGNHHHSPTTLMMARLRRWPSNSA